MKAPVPVDVAVGAGAPNNDCVFAGAVPGAANVPWETAPKERGAVVAAPNIVGADDNDVVVVGGTEAANPVLAAVEPKVNVADFPRSVAGVETLNGDDEVVIGAPTVDVG